MNKIFISPTTKKPSVRFRGKDFPVVVLTNSIFGELSKDTESHDDNFTSAQLRSDNWDRSVQNKKNVYLFTYLEATGRYLVSVTDKHSPTTLQNIGSVSDDDLDNAYCCITPDITTIVPEGMEVAFSISKKIPKDSIVTKCKVNKNKRIWQFWKPTSIYEYYYFKPIN